MTTAMAMIGPGRTIYVRKLLLLGILAITTVKAVPPGVGVVDNTPSVCKARRATLQRKVHPHCRGDGLEGRPKVRRDVPLQYPNFCTHAARHAIRDGCTAIHLLPADEVGAYDCSSYAKQNDAYKKNCGTIFRSFKSNILVKRCWGAYEKIVVEECMLQQRERLGQPAGGSGDSGDRELGGEFHSHSDQHGMPGPPHAKSAADKAADLRAQQAAGRATALRAKIAEEQRELQRLEAAAQAGAGRRAGSLRASSAEAAKAALMQEAEVLEAEALLLDAEADAIEVEGGRDL